MEKVRTGTDDEPRDAGSDDQGSPARGKFIATAGGFIAKLRASIESGLTPGAYGELYIEDDEPSINGSLPEGIKAMPRSERIAQMEATRAEVREWIADNKRKEIPLLPKGFTDDAMGTRRDAEAAGSAEA